MPVDDTFYASIRNGKLTDKEVPADAILPYLGSRKIIKVYLMSIAIAEQYRRWGDGIFQQGYLRLLTGFIDKLVYYAKSHGVRVTHFLATTWTPEGRRICETFGMAEVGKDQFGDSIFELDLTSELQRPNERLMPSLRRLIDLYDQLNS
jgi:hypothetical protein